MADVSEISCFISVSIAHSDDIGSKILLIEFIESDVVVKIQYNTRTNEQVKSFLINSVFSLQNEQKQRQRVRLRSLDTGPRDTNAVVGFQIVESDKDDSFLLWHLRRHER